jgi:hypothetical protein
MPSAQFPELRFKHLDDVVLPKVARVRLRHPAGDPIADIPGAAEKAIRSSARLNAMPAGSAIAVALGSRGINSIPTVARTVIDTLKAMGHAPFVVPAMGSHGGGTAEGQVKVLANLGLTPEALGCEIRATMDVVDYGETPDGARCKFDKNAAGADAVVVINRVKSHTTFDRPIESGLVKMTAVGLGKADGARAVSIRRSHSALRSSKTQRSNWSCWKALIGTTFSKRTNGFSSWQRRTSRDCPSTT